MKVLILAGGFGSRLKSVVSNLPKPMAPIQNRPFLEYLMDGWLQKGATEFYLLTCHLAEKIERHFMGSYKGAQVHCIQEPYPLGTGGALLYALDRIQTQEDLVVVNGDTFFEIDFEQMLAFHLKNASKLTLGLREVESNHRYSGIKLNERRQIELFSKREQNSKHLLINAGVYLVNPSFMRQSPFKREEVLSLEDEIFPKLLDSGKIYGYQAEGKFIDIGIPDDYAKAQQFFVV